MVGLFFVRLFTVEKFATGMKFGQGTPRKFSGKLFTHQQLLSKQSNNGENGAKVGL
jgi:hypothetical protein